MMYADEGGHMDPANPHHYSNEDHEDEEDDDNQVRASGRRGGHSVG